MQPGYPPQPGGYPPPPPRPPDTYPGKGQSIAALVLGIVSLVVPYLGVGTAIAGLILGIMGRKKAMEVGAPTGMATAGLVMSIIGLAGAVLMIVCIVAACAADPFLFSPYTW